MPSSRIPSPARSQGTKYTPRSHKPRASRSVGSPARSNSSVKLTTIIQMNSCAFSPMPSRRSVLTDTTDIDIPRRKSWWKKLDENSREIMEVLNNKEPTEVNNTIEEYIEVDVLSQEKKNYTMDMLESSDGESIRSIVIPQRKLFAQKETKSQKKFAQIIDNRESITTLQKTHGDDDKALNVGRKKLFNQGTKPRSRPLFPSTLLNISANKTISNKTKQLADTAAKCQVKSLFGSRPGSKRKNMFADFIVSDSEDDIPEIQPNVFEFHKRAEQKRLHSLKSCGGSEPLLTSPTTSITDIEMDDWRLLPSSTMVEHQLEDELKTTTGKRARLTKLSEAIESINTETNITTNKTKQSNKSMNSKNQSKHVAQLKEVEDNEFVASKEKNKSTSKTVSHEQSLEENTSTHQICSNGSKSISRLDRVLQSDDDDDDDNDHFLHKNLKAITENDAKNTKESSSTSNHNAYENVNMTKQLQNKSRSECITQQVNEIVNENTVNQLDDNLLNNVRKNSSNSIRNISFSKIQRETSKLQNNEVDNEEMLHEDQILVDIGQNNSKCSKAGNYEEEIQDVLNNQNGSDGYEARQQYNSHNTEMSNKEVDVDNGDIRNQNEQDMQGNNRSVSGKVNIYEEIAQDDQNARDGEDEADDTNDDDQNLSQKGEFDSGQVIEERHQEENRNNEKMYNREDEYFSGYKNEQEKSYSLDLRNCKGKNVNDEIKNYENHSNDNQQDTDKPQNEHTQQKIYNDNQNSLYTHDRPNTPTQEKLEANITHDTTGRHRRKRDADVPSPEVIRHDKPSQIESFSVQGRNTSVRKTKSIINNLSIRRSLAPVRESTGLSSGSIDSSVERSGWDSHRTTRATLRQTFGKDFTPRKSLRTLVMEKSAKRRTNFTGMNAEISTLPQANSTEMCGSRLAHNETNVQTINKFNHEQSPEKTYHISHKIDKSGNGHQINKSYDRKQLSKSDQKLLRNNVVESDDAKQHNLSHETDDTGAPQDNNKFVNGHDNNEPDHEVSCDVDDSDETQKNIKSDQAQVPNESDGVNEIFDEEATLEVDNDVEKTNEAGDSQEISESGQKVSHEINETEEESKINESVNVQEMGESLNNTQEIDGYDDAQEMDKSDYGQQTNESGHAQNMEVSDDEQDIDESGDAQEMDDSNNTEEMDASGDAQNMEVSDDAQDIDESNDAHEMDASGDAQNLEVSDNEHGIDESDDAHEMDDSNNTEEIDACDDILEINASNIANETDVSDDGEEIKESDNAQESDEFEEPHEENESDHKLSCNETNVEVQEIECNHDESRKTRQTTLEMYLQKVNKRNMERKKQLEDEIENSIKATTRDRFNPFKVPAAPKLRRLQTQQIKSKAEPIKSSVIPLNTLPAEVLQDMKYKPPKRYRPTNASWITKRLYKFLETKLEPKYDYKARIRSEKLVETIYNFTKDIRRHSTAPTVAVDALKREMARLDVVKTHFEFYEFFHEYMPREVRVKVVPDVFNKVPLPKHGVFSDILP